jgi:hypothetical protein
MKLASTVLVLALMFSFVPAKANFERAAAATTCDWAQFVADVTVPDGTNFAPGAAFKKTWRLKNIGTCTWTTSYSLVFDSGERMGGPTPVNLPVTVAPGQTVDLTVDMTAPSAAGVYIGYWKFKNASGGLFGIGAAANRSFWVKINVTSGGSSGGTGYEFVANAASATWSSGAGTLSFPGTDGDSRGFSSTGLHWIFEDNSSPQSSMLVAPQNITNGYIQGIYPPFRVQTGDRFQAQVGCELQATGCYVQFRLDYQIGSGPTINYWTFREKWEGLTKSAVVNLDRLAGQDVKFILVVSAYGTSSGDRALWGNPVITRSGGGTPPPAGCTDRALFIRDVNYPDGTSVAPGQTFTKTWQLKNIGTCTWTTSYSLIFDSGEQMGGPASQALPRSVGPNESVDISVPLTAPSTGGNFTGNWKLKNSNGVAFGLCPFGNCFLGNQKAFWVKINVPGTGTVNLIPDLIIENIYVEMQGRQGSACVNAYTPYELRVRIKNAGTADARSFYVDANAVRQTVTLLAAGQSMEVAFSTFPSGGLVRAVVDPANQVTESNESNNTRELTTVVPTPPALCTPTATATMTNTSPPPPSATATATPTATMTPTP